MFATEMRNHRDAGRRAMSQKNSIQRESNYQPAIWPVDGQLRPWQPLKKKNQSCDDLLILEKHHTAA